jgi:uncharacterized membrane protein
MEVWLSRILRGGVVISSVIILVGIALIFVHHPSYATGGAGVDVVIREMAAPHSLAEVFWGIAQGEGRAIIVLGLCVLIATPMARVAASLLLFLHQRDKKFVLITSLVLLLLLLSFWLGRAEL